MSENSAFSTDQYQVYSEGGKDHYWTLARHRILMRYLRRAGVTGASVIVDVGCGPGLTVDYLRKLGLNAVGCDIGAPTPINDEVSQHLYLGSDISRLPEAIRSKATTVLLLDVLEHVSEPARLLADVVREMPALQTIVVMLPARQELWTNYDDYYGHKRRYDLEAVNTLSSTAGVSLRKQLYFFHSLYIPLRILATLGIRRSLLQGQRPIPAWIHRFLASCLVAEEQLVPDWVVGSSILAILEPRR